MGQPPEQIQSELENFREQWRAEVSARSKNTAGGSSQQHRHSQAVSSSASASKAPPRKLESSHRRAPSKTLGSIEDEEDYVQTQIFDQDAGNAKETLQPEDGNAAGGEKEPETALDFYEKAVDQETTGKLGESLQLYRRAYRLDNHVDRAYREKHFPGQWKKKPAGQLEQPGQPGQSNPSHTAATDPTPAPQSVEKPAPLSLPDLIASFAGLSVQGAPPEVEGMPQPPCPISGLPDEILVHILRDVAIMDIGDFVRLAQVCKRFAYLVVTENQIWRRVCIGSEFGFGAMIHYWQKGVSWEALDVEHLLSGDTFTIDELQQQQAEESEATTNALLKSAYSSSWQRMFRQRPRIRFNGCYISTVNYIRTGHASGNHITWNSPVHIVTYYRYLRFFRDGTAISLLTTNEPVDVVHYLTKELVYQHENNASLHLPSAVMSHAHKGRWRLSLPLDNPEADLADAEGELIVETEGVGPKLPTPKYMYRMELSLKSAGKARNNKLMWKGFWCYNKLTDDWGEFGLKNDKAFYFSRVKSYGFGEE